jgi:signal transduction histidine kinase
VDFVDRLIRVLHIEDSPSDTDLVRGVLGRSVAAQFTVEAVSTLEGGLRRLTDQGGAQDFDVIVLDLHLPDADGLTTFTRAAAAAGAVPIVVCTAGGDDTLGITAVEHGAQDFVVKWSSDPDSLGRTLIHAVQRSRQLAILHRRLLEERPGMGPAKPPEATLEARSASNPIREFLAMVVHEIRTPITVISGYAALLRDAPDTFTPIEQLESLSAILGQTERLQRLTDTLLTHENLEAGAVHAEPEEVCVVEVIDSALAAAGPAAVDFKVRCDPGLTARVDPAHLHQALLNYATNALTYGERPYSVTADLEEDPAEVVIRVIDHGAGVPQEFVPHLFDRIAASRAARSKGLHGTGLGLSIVAGLLHANGGDAWYEPGDPGGARFCIRLPARAALRRS